MTDLRELTVEPTEAGARAVMADLAKHGTPPTMVPCPSADPIGPAPCAVCGAPGDLAAVILIAYDDPAGIHAVSAPCSSCGHDEGELIQALIDDARIDLPPGYPVTGKLTWLPSDASLAQAYEVASNLTMLAAATLASAADLIDNRTNTRAIVDVARLAAGLPIAVQSDAAG